MAFRQTTVFFAMALLVSLLGASVGKAQQTSAPVKANQVIGLEGIKQNAKGSLKVENGNMHFTNGKRNSEVAVTSIHDVVASDDTQRAVGGTVGVMSMAAPYGGGRFLSLFRKKIDTLTIRYRDADGGLHGAIFTLPLGIADAMKSELVSEGAQTSPTPDPNATASSPSKSAATQQEAQQPLKRKSEKIRASAIQVEMIQSNEITLPAAFQIALYENLVGQLKKHGTFQHVYRDGDRNAASIPDLVVLNSTVSGFKAGSERKRQVTTVAGATSISVHCQFTNSDGTLLREQDVNGKVRFFGGNLKATYDFAKKAANAARENFSSSE